MKRPSKAIIKKVNIKILKRDDFQCQICKRKKYPDKKDLRLTVHHILPLDRGGKWIDSNMVSLCSRCHNKLHKYEKSPNRVRLTDLEKKFIDVKHKRIYNNNLTDITVINEELLKIDNKLINFPSKTARVNRIKRLKSRRNKIIKSLKKR